MDIHRAKYENLRSEMAAVDAQVEKTNAEIADSHDRIAVAKDDKNKAEAQLASLAE